MPIPRHSKVVLLIGLLVMGAIMPGCVPWSRGLRTIDEKVTDWRDFIWGKRAFFQRYGQGESGPFMDGFLEGYHDMLQGADGCLPVVPPRRYWNWKYQSAGGQGAVSEWFNGYSAGVTAAKEDGLANISRVPISSQYNGSSTVPIQVMPSHPGEEWAPFEESIAPQAIPIPPATEPGNSQNSGAFYFDPNQPIAGVVKAAAKNVTSSTVRAAGTGVNEILPITRNRATVQGDLPSSRPPESLDTKSAGRLPPIVKDNDYHAPLPANR